jgi:hypothetical protein
MRVLAYNLLHMIGQFYVWGEGVRRLIDWLIKRMIKVGASSELTCFIKLCINLKIIGE